MLLPVFERLSGGLEDISFLFLADVELVHDSTIQLVEDVALAADVVDLVSQIVVDRQCLIELLHHLQYNKSAANWPTRTTQRRKLAPKSGGPFLPLLSFPSLLLPSSPLPRPSLLPLLPFPVTLSPSSLPSLPLLLPSLGSLGERCKLP